jgi:hypothetical protein
MAQLIVEDPSSRLYVPRARPEPAQAPQADPWAGMQEIQLGNDNTPAPPISGPQGIPGSDPWAGQPEIDLAAEKQRHREVGMGEAVGRGLLHGATLGLSPAIEGASAAAEPDIEAAAKKFGLDPEMAKSFLNHVAPNLKTIYGAGRVAYDKATHTGEPTPAQAAYEGARSKEAQANETAYEEHPYLYTGGNIAGSMAVPLPGTGALKVGATLGPRLVRGIGAGAVGGGAFGAGNAIGEGKSAGEIASDVASGALEGGTLGGVLHGVVGPRARPPGLSPGQRAAQTAEKLGAPLPIGVVSDSPAIQGMTAKMAEVPLAGEKIGERVRNTQRAAGDRIEDMATNLVGGEPTRQTAGDSAAPALRQMIEANNTEIDRAYNALRNEINPDQHAPMPNLRKALNDIYLKRARAGWQNPGEGLQQAENVANRVGHAGGFNGVHRLRRDLREAGNPARANPGYDKGDFRYLKTAVDKDLRNLVRHVSVNPNRAESLFNTAEMTAGPIIQLNERLERLAGRHGESIVGALLGSAKEKGGNLALLREIRRTMDPAAFNQISGVMLHELGQAEGQPGAFSLSKFATSWGKVSDEAKNLMFSPQHREQIENIVGLGNHLKNASRYSNTSHTGAFVAVLELAETARELITHGGLNMATAGILVSTGGGYLLTHWLASPSTSASLSRWTSAYRALTLNQPTPARIAVFKIATRNLSNTIHVPFDRIMQISADHLASEDQSRKGL